MFASKISKSRIFISGFLILLLYAFISLIVYNFILLKFESFLKSDNMLELRIAALSRNISETVKATEDIIRYSKKNNEAHIKSSLVKLKDLIPLISKDFNDVNKLLKKNPYMAKQVLSYMRKVKHHWKYYIAPVLYALIKYHRYVANKIFYRPILFDIYKSLPVFSPFAVKAIVNQTKDTNHLINQINIVYLLSSFAVFGIILLSLIIIVYENEKVKESEAKYRQMFKEHSAVLLLVDIETGEIMDANRGAEIFYGYSMDELARMNITDLNVILSPEELKRFRYKVAAKKATVGFFKHRLKNGEFRYVESYAAPINIGKKLYVFVIVHDITARKILEERLEESEELFKAVSENIINGIVLYKDKIFYVNPSALKIFGYTKEEFYDMHALDFYSGNEKEAVKNTIARRLKGEKFSSTDTLKALSKDKREFWLLVYSTTISYRGEWAVLSSFTDISARIELEEELNRQKKLYEQLSETDPLTGIYNRRKFESSLLKSMKISGRYDRPLSLIMFDIDNFKLINDSFGHQVGDVVLKELAGLIKTILRDTDVLARYGGEEFMILLPETDIENTKMMAERIRSLVESHVFQVVDAVTVSIGIAEYKKGDSIDDFIKNVDYACYDAKLGGRNRVEAYTWRT